MKYDVAQMLICSPDGCKVILEIPAEDYSLDKGFMRIILPLKPSATRYDGTMIMEIPLQRVDSIHHVVTDGSHHLTVFCEDGEVIYEKCAQLRHDFNLRNDEKEKFSREAAMFWEALRKALRNPRNLFPNARMNCEGVEFFNPAFEKIFVNGEQGTSIEFTAKKTPFDISPDDTYIILEEDACLKVPNVLVAFKENCVCVPGHSEGKIGEGMIVRDSSDKIISVSALNDKKIMQALSGSLPKVREVRGGRKAVAHRRNLDSSINLIES